MNNLKLEQTIAKLNRLTNGRFQLSSNQQQLCVNDIFYFRIHWTDALEAQSSLQRLENGDEKITIFNRITPSQSKQLTAAGVNYLDLAGNAHRSEERRVGKECRSGWWADHVKKERDAARYDCEQ